MEISNSVTVTSVNTPIKVLDVPNGYVAYLRSLILSNGATATARVIVRSGDGTAAEDYVILVVRVPAGSNVILGKDELEGFRAIKSIYVVTDQQPLDVSIAVDLM
jgi:hypothetical protein